MFAAAPPLYVVALLFQLWWIPIRLLQVAGWDSVSEHAIDISRSMGLVGTVLLVGASWELVRRSRGRVRVGMVLTFASNVVGLALQLFWIYVMSRFGHAIGLNALNWTTAAVYLLAAIGLAIAAGRSVLGTSSIVVVLTALVVISPVRLWILDVGGSEFVFWFFTAVAPLRVVLLLILVAAIAKRCYEPVRDHRRASRRFALLAWLFAARAMFACVIAAVGSASTTTQLGLVGVEFGLLALIVIVMWGIAQTQLPRLPRFSMHVGMIGVMISLFMIAQITTTLLEIGMKDWVDYRRYVAIDAWQLATASIGAAVWLVAMWRYAKRAPASKRSVALAAIVFAAATGYELIGDNHLWICEVIACIALIPAFRAMAKALADDPVKTTADVFA